MYMGVSCHIHTCIIYTKKNVSLTSADITQLIFTSTHEDLGQEELRYTWEEVAIYVHALFTRKKNITQFILPQHIRIRARKKFAIYIHALFTRKKNITQLIITSTRQDPGQEEVARERDLDSCTLLVWGSPRAVS
jgi:hypothetical protein